VNPLQKIRQGILENNMSLVIDGYASMTGEDLSVKEKVVKKRGRPKKTPVSKTPKAKPVENFYQEKVGGGEARFDRNTWVDDGSLHREPLTEIEKKIQDKIQSNIPKKPPYKTINVECYKCNRKYDVNPAYTTRNSSGETNYICERCL